jgi:hypothetical protein
MSRFEAEEMSRHKGEELNLAITVSNAIQGGSSLYAVNLAEARASWATGWPRRRAAAASPPEPFACRPNGRSRGCRSPVWS